MEENKKTKKSPIKIILFLIILVVLCASPIIYDILTPDKGISSSDPIKVPLNSTFGYFAYTEDTMKDSESIWYCFTPSKTADYWLYVTTPEDVHCVKNVSLYKNDGETLIADFYSDYMPACEETNDPPEYYYGPGYAVHCEKDTDYMLKVEYTDPQKGDTVLIGGCTD